MVEHVGEAQIDEYARQIAECWSRAAGCSTTASSWSRPRSAAPTSAASSRTATCSPTASCSTCRACCCAFERAGFEALNVENLHTDYAETLRHWTTRFEEHLDEAERLAGPERMRVWRLYLRAARN